MTQLDELINKLGLENQIALEDIPNIDLYMDQVTQLFESKFHSSKRDETDKLLTKTMINNYAKGKLLFSIKNKKYSKEHIMLINFIFQLKGALSIKDIKVVLDELNEQLEHDDVDLSDLYKGNQSIYEQLTLSFKKDTQQIEDSVTELLGNSKDDATYYKQLLLVTSLVNMSSMYRRLAEEVVDEIKESNLLE